MAGRRLGRHARGHHRAAGATRPGSRTWPSTTDSPTCPTGRCSTSGWSRRWHARRPARWSPIHLLDLDLFKNVNDTLGHSASATSCSRRWPTGCAPACGRRTRWRAWAATSSPSCRRHRPAADAATLADRIIEAIGAALRHRRPPGLDRDQRRHRRGAADGTDADQLMQECRPRALPGQERGPRHLPLLRAGHGRADAGAPRARAATCARPWRRRVRAALPADPQSRAQRDQRRRGARALAPPRARA